MSQTPVKTYRARLAALRKRLREENVDAAVISSEPKLRYLTGYTGSNGLLIVGQRVADFFTDGRYRTQVIAEVKGARAQVGERDLLDNLPKYRPLVNGRPKVGYEQHELNAARIAKLKSTLPKAVFVGFSDLVEPLAMRKSPDEIAAIKKAIRVAEDSLGAILQLVKPGIREFELAAELEYQMKMRGSEDPAFGTIVASGPRSALPHGRASERRLKSGEFLTVDFGAKIDGYVSDITRTFVVGKASAKHRKIYDLVRRAQAAGIRKCKAKTSCAAVDKAARDIIKKAGYGKYFDHGLGHGIGLVVHEGPALSSRSKQSLEPGMVVTVEPGVYLPRWGGVRIEDDVLITRNGSDVLTSFDRGLMELG